MPDDCRSTVERSEAIAGLFRNAEPGAGAPGSVYLAVGEADLAALD